MSATASLHSETKFSIVAAPARPAIRAMKSRLPADLAIRDAQRAWDRYFVRMLQLFHEPNPDQNRDLALDKTIRAMGSRPVTSAELAVLPITHPARQTTVRGSGFSTRDLHLNRKHLREAQIESLCDAAIDD